MKLRKYQKKIIKKIKKARRKHNHTLVSAPTGSGKTVMFATLCEEWASKKQRTLILVPRTSLINQIYDTLQNIGFDMTKVTIHHRGRTVNHKAKVHIAMINTIYNRFKKYGKRYIGRMDNVIIDEVHIGHRKGMYKEVEKLYWDKAKWFGFSATPMDSYGYMLEGYDHLLHDIQTIDLVDDGYLLPLTIYKEKSPDLNNVGTVAGEYNQKELAKEMEKGSLVSNAYDVWSNKFADKKTMIFCVNIDHAELVAERFRTHGVKVVVSHSENSNAVNDNAHKSFKEGAAQVLISINKLTAGFDEPSVEVLLTLRPTKTRSLYLQAVGRVLRPHPSMEHAILIDCAGWINEFGHPFERLELESKPQKKEKSEGKAKLKHCIECDFGIESFIIEAEYLDDGVMIRKLCPNCDAVNDEQYTEYRDISELEIVPDPSQIYSVKREMVGRFVEDIRKHKGYKAGWTRFVAKDAIQHPEFMDYLKVLHNKYKLGKITLNTALANINAYRKTL